MKSLKRNAVVSANGSHEESPRALPVGFYPFWFWNDDLTEPEIRRQIAEMAAQGCRGFFIHPRQGLKQPYLSEAFFRRVDVALAEAARHGLVAHVNDEYPYPSGAAGGEVILGNPQFQATQLIQQSFDVLGGSIRLELPRGRVLSCQAFPLRLSGAVDWARPIDLRDHVGMVLTDESYVLMGLTRYNAKRYFASHPTPILETVLPKRSYRICVAVQAQVEDHKYWGHFIDVLNPEAVRYFMDCTHERYSRRFGTRLGKHLYSFFVDETTPHWSARLPAAFQAAYGYDLLPLLPALEAPNHPQHLRVATDIQRLKYCLFCESFEEPVSQWCARHGIRYGGEKPSLRLSQLRYMDIPGCDPGHTKAGAPMDLLQASIRGNARATASAAYFYGKEGALCECYHSLGWSGTLQDAKLIAEGLLLMGIRYLVPHGFFYSTHALRKHDAPPSFFFQMPYWPLFGRLSERVERVARHFEGTHMTAEVLVVDPTPGLPGEKGAGVYQQILNLLMARHVDFLVVDTDILETGRLKEGRVCIRDIAARVVIVPPMRVVEPTLARWLKRFERSGGVAIRVSLACDESRLARQLAAAVRPQLKVEAVRGDATKVQVVSRTDGCRRIWFVLNTGNQSVTLALDADGPLREHPLDGDLPAELEQADGGVTRTLTPYESILIEAGGGNPTKTAFPRVRIQVGGVARIRPLGANLLRMHNWNMSVAGKRGRTETRAVSAVPLVNQLEEGGFAFTPLFRKFFGSMPELELPELRVRYVYRFANAFRGPVKLVMEPGSIAGEWEIRVNGGSAIRKTAFRETTAHVHGSLAVPVTQYLRQGRNEIVVEVRSKRMDEGLLNPLYLAGGFGVELNPVRLVTQRAEGGFETYEANGLPHYSGVVEYESQFTLARMPTGKRMLADLEFSPGFEDACEVSFNGGPWHVAAWSPRRVVVRAGELKAGRNCLRVRVYTSLIRSFEGQYFDQRRHAYRTAR